MTQAAFAEAVGCKRSMVNLIEKGVRSPSPRLAEKMQRLTGIDARILLGITTRLPRRPTPSAQALAE